MKNIILANKELNEWCGTKGINYYEGIEALGFLFKYAVPKIRDLRWVKLGANGNCEIRIGNRAVFNQPVKSIIDPALALFYAILEVINE
ncbi:hypothetical protein LCGC14_0514340 [marine sediment metagenome]|uniref:Uncharacterized protein n=1 Tax=marine sediment metagenome TaxID=412755 RepID=A0A0F9S074_9ZZZZ